MISLSELPILNGPAGIRIISSSEAAHLSPALKKKNAAMIQKGLMNTRHL
jgi:hypothetical protein